MVAKIGKYTVEKELGHGGFGDVYLALDPDVGQKVAIKHLRVELGTDPDMLRRFQHEIRTTASLRHKNIVAIFASGVENGNPYLVMEFLEGQTLKDVIATQRPLTLLEKVNIMTQAAEGLAYAHGKGIVHRDVKPENIMLLPDDSVKIMDFGIALAPDRNTVMTATGGIIGTPPYFAPEQLEGYKATEQTDIFSLGDVYYELLSGKHPFERFRHDWKALQLAILSHDPPAVSQFVPGCPESLELLVHRMLAKDAEFRYRTFDEMIIDSRSILADLQQERALSLLQEVHPLVAAGDLQAALGKVREVQQLDPGNREARQLRDTITHQLQKVHVQGRVAEQLAEAASLMGERRFAEAVQSLESAARLDGTNTTVLAKLAEARAKLEASVRASRLVAEARYNQQKGLLAEALDRLSEALSVDPQHTEAVVMSPRLREQLERREREGQRKRVLEAASGHLEAKRFSEALAILAKAEQENPGAADVAQLRQRVELAKTEEDRRIRTEKFQLGLARTREALEGGELDLARQMIDHLVANFSSERGAAEALPALRDQLATRLRKQQVESTLEEARALMERKAFADAVDVLARARARHGDDPALAKLEQQAAREKERERYNAGLELLLDVARERMDAGKYAQALEGLTQAREYAGVASVKALRVEIEQAQRRIAIEGQRTEIRRAIQDQNWKRAETALRQARTTFPNDSAFDDLAAQVEAGIFNSRLDEIAAEVQAKLAAGKLDDAARQLDATRSGYSHDARWKSLSTEVARQKEEAARQKEIAALAEKVRSWIQRDDLRQALGELERGRAKFPGQAIWTTLQDELDARQALLRRLAEIPELAEAVRVCLRRDDIGGAQKALAAARSKYAGEEMWATLDAEIATAQKKLRQKEIDGVAAAIRQSVEQDDVVKATAQLRAAMQDYAGEPVWGVLQADIAKRQRALTEIAATTDTIRKQLERDDVRKAAGALAAARTKYPAERIWGTLEAEIAARESAIREKEAGAAAEEIRRSLDRSDVAQAGKLLDAARKKYTGDGQWEGLQTAIVARQGSVSAAAEIRRSLERGEIAQATKQLAAARAKYPAEPQWDGLAEEIAARQQAVAAGDEVRRSLERGEVAQAAKLLTAARAKYPGDRLWEGLQAEIAARQGATAAAEEIRRSLERNDLAQAAKLLATARSKYAGDRLWDSFETEIAARQKAAAEEARQASLREIGAKAEAIRAQLKRDDLQAAGTALSAAQARYPGEPEWETLAGEIAARAGSLREKDVAGAAAGIRKLLDAENFRQAATDLGAARAKFPGEGVWDRLQSEIDAATAAEGIRKQLQAGDLKKASTALAAARAKYPNESRWDALQAEINALQGSQREIQVAAAAEAIRKLNLADNFRQATANLAAARAKYPDEAVWETLLEEIAARQAALRDQEIAATATSIRQLIERNEMRQAGAALTTARSGRPGERIWETLQQEIDGRGRTLREIDTASQTVRKHLQRDEVAQAESVLANARAKYPSQQVWETLAAEIAARAGTGEEIDALAENIREFIHDGELQPARSSLAAARSRYAGQRIWDTIEGEIEAKATLLRDSAATAERIREYLKRGELQRGDTELAAARSKYPTVKVWDLIEAEIAGYQEQNIRQHLQADHLRQALAELAAASTRFPGEPVWDELSAALEARQRVLVEIAATAEQIRKLLAAGEAQRAAADLAVARKGRPGERIWDTLQGEIDARQGSAPEQEIAATAEQIRKLLAAGDVQRAAVDLVIARKGRPGERIWDTLQGEIDARQERERDVAIVAEQIRTLIAAGDVQRAAADLAVAKKGRPGERLWDTLQAEIEARQERERDVAIAAEQIRTLIAAGDVQRAAADLAVAKKGRPGERVWDTLQAEIEARQEREHDVAIAAEQIRKLIAAADLQRAVADLAIARKGRPGERAWDTLQAEIEARQEREQDVALAAEQIRKLLAAGDVQRAAADLAVARKGRPGERVWDALEAEIEARQGSVRDQEVAAAAESIRRLLAAGNSQKAAMDLAAARARHPGHTVLEALHTEVRRHEIAGVAESIRKCLERDDLKQAATELGAAQTRFPGERQWATFKEEIDARQKARKRQDEIAAASQKVRALLEKDDFKKASAELVTAKRKYPQDPAWAALEAEIAERQKSRQPQTRGAGPATVEPVKPEPVKAEPAKVVERPVSAPAVVVPEPKKAPWKWIGIGLGATAAVGGALVVGPHLFHKDTPVIPPISNVPVQVRSDPPGASVTIGDKNCVAPACNFDLPPGSYTAQGTLSGFEPGRKSFTIDANSAKPTVVDLSLTPVAPPPPPTTVAVGQLTIRAGQAGAMVKVDGKEYGRTDASGAYSLKLEAKAHDIHVEKDRYQPVDRKVTIKRDGEESLSVTLAPKEARLEFLNAPAGVEVRVAGKLVGKTDGSANFRFRETIPPGQQTLQVTQGATKLQVARNFLPDGTMTVSWGEIAPGKTGGTTPPIGTPPPVTPTGPTEEEKENREWATVRISNDANQVRAFLAGHPNGTHRPDAENLLDGLLWGSVNKDSVDSLQAFVKANPKSSHVTEANMRIANLPWNKVDKTKADDLRRFIAENPGNPNRAQAQQLLDALNKDTEQARLKAELSAQKGKVLDALQRFNHSYQVASKSELKAVWPSVPGGFVEAMSQATLDLKPSGDPAITGDQATIICAQTTTIRGKVSASRNVRITLQKQGDGWVITDLKAN